MRVYDPVFDDVSIIPAIGTFGRHGGLDRYLDAVKPRFLKAAIGVCGPDVEDLQELRCERCDDSFGDSNR